MSKILFSGGEQDDEVECNNSAQEIRGFPLRIQLPTGAGRCAAPQGRRVPGPSRIRKCGPIHASLPRGSWQTCGGRPSGKVTTPTTSNSL